jgi:CheY-like chemotaxis protein
MNLSRILHVDDEPDIRELVDISLGFDTELSVRSCSSGSEAISVAAEWSPDVILMDVMMPVMDGPATLGELRKRNETARIPVVFMTARAQARELAHFLSLGAAGIISKPFDPMTLAASVKQYLNGVEPVAGSTRRSPVDRRAEALAELSAKTGTD